MPLCCPHSFSLWPPSKVSCFVTFHQLSHASRNVFKWPVVFSNFFYAGKSWLVFLVCKVTGHERPWILLIVQPQGFDNIVQQPQVSTLQHCPLVLPHACSQHNTLVIMSEDVTTPKSRLSAVGSCQRNEVWVIKSDMIQGFILYSILYNYEYRDEQRHLHKNQRKRLHSDLPTSKKAADIPSTFPG